MNAKHVLVTGASGFIGQPLVRALVRSGYAVRAATRSTKSFSNSVDVTPVPDFTQTIDWQPILRGIDIVIHLAGHAHADLPERDYSIFNRVNFMATRELACRAARTGVERFLYISSVRAQSGASAKGLLSEQDEPQPTDNYGRSKLAAELAVRAAGVPFTIIRPVVVYGPGVKGNLKTVARLALSPLPLPFGGLQNQRSLLGIDNLISALLFVLSKPEALGQTYLVADTEPVTIPQLFTMLRQAQGRPPKVFYVPPRLLYLLLIMSNRAQLWSRLAQGLVVDTTKLRSIGWHAPFETLHGLHSMFSLNENE
jgi:UDP-glucose 4-epimerase